MRDPDLRVPVRGGPGDHDCPESSARHCDLPAPPQAPRAGDPMRRPLASLPLLAAPQPGDGHPVDRRGPLTERRSVPRAEPAANDRADPERRADAADAPSPPERRTGRDHRPGNPRAGRRVRTRKRPRARGDLRNHNRPRPSPEPPPTRRAARSPPVATSSSSIPPPIPRRSSRATGSARASRPIAASIGLSVPSPRSSMPANERRSGPTRASSPSFPTRSSGSPPRPRPRASRGSVPASRQPRTSTTSTNGCLRMSPSSTRASPCTRT